MVERIDSMLGLDVTFHKVEEIFLTHLREEQHVSVLPARCASMVILCNYVPDLWDIDLP